MDSATPTNLQTQVFTNQITSTVPPDQIVTASPQGIPSLASFGRRLLAWTVDIIIIGFVGLIIGIPLMMGMSFGNWNKLPTSSISLKEENGTIKYQPMYESTDQDFQNQVFYSSILPSFVGAAINIVVTFGYLVVSIGKFGRTLGKLVMGIKVVNAENNQSPGFGKAALREILGKFVSTILFPLGYLWMLWDSKKQTWHDKVAGTIVINI